MGNREAMQSRKKDRAEADTALEVAGSKNQPQTRGWGDSVGVNRAWRAHKSLHSRNIVKGVSRLSTQLRAVQFRPFAYDTIKTDEPRTLDFSGVRGFLVTNVCIVQRSAA